MHMESGCVMVYALSSLSHLSHISYLNGFSDVVISKGRSVTSGGGGQFKYLRQGRDWTENRLNSCDFGRASCSC